MNRQFNYTELRPQTVRDLGVPNGIASIVTHLNRQMLLLSRALLGAVVYDAGVSGAAVSINPTIADITELELTDNTTVTLSLTDLRKGMSGAVEFTQDATGGRTVGFTNLVGTSPAIAAGANARTLVQFIHVGDGWVAHVLASAY